MHEHRGSCYKFLRRALQVALGGAVLSCSVDLTPPPPSAPPRPGPVISISATHLSWTTDSVVRYSISNPDGVSIFWTCPLDGLEYYRDGWRSTSYSYGCVGDGPSYVALPAGDSIVASRRLTSDFIPKSGWYRFTFYLFRTASSQVPWGEASRVSPAFYAGP
jgi:hypothetical protein